MTTTYAIVKDSKVVNIIVWDGLTDWVPPAGCTAVPTAEGAAINGTYDGKTFTPPPTQQPAST